MDPITFIDVQLQESAQIMTRIRADFREAILEAAETMIAALRNGHKILICGNGGSAADASHFAAELVGRLQRDRRALPAIALTTDISILTAVGNDYGYDQVFRKQVEALGQSGDVLIAISTSGNSPNILTAIETARLQGMTVIGLTGRTGGEMVPVCDQALIMPAASSQHIQEGHIAIIHIWCEIIEDTLFPAGGTALR